MSSWARAMEIRMSRTRTPPSSGFLLPTTTPFPLSNICMSLLHLHWSTSPTSRMSLQKIISIKRSRPPHLPPPLPCEPDWPTGSAVFPSLFIRGYSECTVKRTCVSRAYTSIWGSELDARWSNNAWARGEESRNPPTSSFCFLLLSFALPAFNWIGAIAGTQALWFNGTISQVNLSSDLGWLIFAC